MSTLRDKLRLAIYQGLQEGERAIELTDRVLSVLVSQEPSIDELRQELIFEALEPFIYMDGDRRDAAASIFGKLTPGVGDSA